MNSFRFARHMAPQSVSAKEDDSVFYRSLKAGALCAIALGLGITTSAYAQDAAKPEAGEPKNNPLTLDEVTVTGTRIQQRGDYVSPNPITTIGQEDLQKLGIVNVADAMTQIPQNVSQFTPANTGGSAFFVGSTLANLRGLNPFFGTRTLTLVDSRRFIPTTQGDSVDLNFIPSNLVQRMEVVTGGASAAYGSGAISGVVNVILDKKLQGVKVDVDYGETAQSDGKNYHVGLAGGTDLFDGRGHIIAGGEYQKSDSIDSCSDARDWCAKGVGLYNNGPAFGANNVPFTPHIAGLPQYVLASNLRYNQINYNGVIYNNNPSATSTNAFNDAGTGLVPFAVGQAGGFASGGTVIGGDGPPTYKNITLYPEVKRQTAYTHMEFEFTDRLTGYAEGSYGKVNGVNHQWSPFQGSANVCVHPDNAYIQGNAPVQAAIAAFGNNNYLANNAGCGDLAVFIGAPPGSFGPYLPGTAITKDWSAQNDDTVITDTKVIRGVVGLNGKLGGSWTWDAYYQYGKTTRDQIGYNYRTNWRYEMATDAVIDTRPGSPTLGKPVCRVTVTGILPSPSVDPSLAVGCQPLNPFGVTGASPQAMAYAFGNLTEHDDIRQDVVAASLTGELWKGWGAGPLSAATGVEWRKDELANLAGDLPFAQRTDFGAQYGDSFGGTTKITEEFLELEMPLLRDKPVVKSLTVNAAGRHASYDQQGGIGTTGANKTVNIDTWKVALVWDPIDWLRFRGSLSSDLRAPGFRELYYSQSIPAGGFFGSVNNPFIPASRLGGQSDQSVLILSGDPTLSPEQSRTTTFGLVLSPKGWAESMHFSADYYRIKLTGGLALGSAQDTVAKCFAGNQTYCGYLTFGPPLLDQATQKPIPNSNITSVRDFYLNQSPYETKGIDFSWDYLLGLSDLFSGAEGRLAFRLTASHTISTKIPSGRDVAGQTGGDAGFLSDFASSPDWSGTLTTSYINGAFTGTLQTRFINSGVLDLQNPKRGPGDAGYNPAMTYSVTDNTVASYFRFDVTASYDFKWFNLDKLQAFVSVDNVLDKVPPFAGAPGQAGNVGGTNAAFFDTLGRSYRVGMRMAF
jgi:iron complex outermembrane recepter protein